MKTNTLRASVAMAMAMPAVRCARPLTANRRDANPYECFSAWAVAAVSKVHDLLAARALEQLQAHV